MTTLGRATMSSSTQPVAIESRPPSMRVIDPTSNPRIPIVLDLVRSLSQSQDPREVLKVFAEGVNRLYGPRGYISLSRRDLEPGQYRVTRQILGDSNERIYLADPWSVIRTLPIHSGGLLGEIIAEPVPKIVLDLDVRDDPVLGGALSEFRSLLAIPLFDNGEPLNWSITLSHDPDTFTVEGLEETILRANLVGGTVKNTLIAKQLREANDRIQREMDQIAKIQRSLLPQTLPKVPGLSIATSYETFDTAGGDLYDFALMRRLPNGELDPDGPVGMLIADASGHGPAAAVVTAMLNAIMYAYPGGRNLAGGRAAAGGPAEVLEYANRHLYSKRLEGTFVTAFLAGYDPADRSLHYARAGHNPPLIKNAGPGGVVMRLDDIGGVPLGIVPEVKFDNSRIILKPGQTLVMYTDGIPEAMNPQREMFGLEGIERALEQCSGEPACVINSITTALKEHEAGIRPSDDQTIVAIKVE